MTPTINPWFQLAWQAIFASLCITTSVAQQTLPEFVLQSVDVDGQLNPSSGQWVIRATMDPAPEVSQACIFSLEQEVFIQLDEVGAQVRSHVVIQVIQGDLHEVELLVEGTARIDSVAIPGVDYWWVRREVDDPDKAYLVLKTKQQGVPLRRLEGVVGFESQPLEWDRIQGWLPPSLEHPSSNGFSGGYLAVAGSAERVITVSQQRGLTSLDPEELPSRLRSQTAGSALVQQGYRFFQGGYHLRLSSQPADPDRRPFVLESVTLEGNWQQDAVLFEFKGEVLVRANSGASIPLLEGDATLVEWQTMPHGKWRHNPPRPLVVQAGQTLSSIARDHQTSVGHLARINDLDPDRLRAGQTIEVPDLHAGTGYAITFDQPGRYPIAFRFLARLDQSRDGWSFSFSTAPSLIRRVILQDLPENVKIGEQSTLMPDPNSEEDTVGRFLASQDGRIALELLRDVSSTSSRLFFSTQSLEQISISPGMMRQTNLTSVEIMQGAMTELEFELEAEGELVSVQCDSMVGWEITGESKAASRVLRVRLNEPQRQAFDVVLESQHALGDFPQKVRPLRLKPLGATRHQGWVRVVNQGAVRLQVIQATGYSQISVDQLMSRPGAEAFFASQPQQAFGYRHTSGEREMVLGADNILPEVGVSSLLIYQVGLADTSIEAELEVDVREAPIRELQLEIPADFALSGVEAPGLVDSFIDATPSQGRQGVRLLFGQAFIGRRLVSIQLERNQAPQPGVWELPPVNMLGARTVRGHVAVVADLGLRLRPVQEEGLSEIANGFFPRQLEGIQLAFRLRETDWRASIEIEQLDQSIMADVLHLHTIGEGMVYGSSVLQYFITGAPMSQIGVRMAEDYYNVEFTGPEVRDWTRTPDGYLVDLHRPVSAGYTLLVSYERPFDARGEAVGFDGASPIGVQSEQGYLIVTSSDQYRIQPLSVPDTFKAIESTEVPEEHRLFIHSPMLASYQYSRQSQGLTLSLEPLAQHDTLDLVVDRALIQTRVSVSGEIVTDARYFIKSQGNTTLPIRLPAEAALWSVSVDEASVAPIKDEEAYQIPIKLSGRPGLIQEVNLRWAQRSKRPERLLLETARLEVPMVLAEWVVEADADRELRFLGGNIVPHPMPAEPNGWSTLAQVLDVMQSSGQTIRWRLGLSAMLALIVLGVARLTSGHRSSVSWIRRWTGSLLAMVASCMSLMILSEVADEAIVSEPVEGMGSLRFTAPVVEKAAFLSLDLEQVGVQEEALGLGSGLVLLLAAGLWLGAWLQSSQVKRMAMWAGCWSLGAMGLLSMREGWFLFVGWLGLFFFLHMVLPALWSLRRPLATSLSCWITAVCFGGGVMAQAQDEATVHRLDQTVRIEGKTARVAATFQWQSQGRAILIWGDASPRVNAVNWIRGAGRLIQVEGGDWAFLVEHAGDFEVRCEYLLEVEARQAGHYLALPAARALIHRLHIEVPERTVSLSSAEAISITRDQTRQGASGFSMQMRPADKVGLTLTPQMRDMRQEQARYFAEWNHLLLPSGGLIEGFHRLQLRMAQGQLDKLEVQIPASWTIADVWGETTGQDWYFDPDNAILHVPVDSGSGADVAIMLHTQLAVGPLPVSQPLAMPRVTDAVREAGVVGVAVLSDVQLDQVDGQGVSAIQLEDFDPVMIQAASHAAQEQPVVKRAFSYGGEGVSLVVQASSVSPDLRVVTQQTLSLAENRSLLSVDGQLTITRAGLFQVRFPLPGEMDVESISGDGISHWTESILEGRRWVTVHFRDRTMGKISLNATFSGPGPSAEASWDVPVIRLDSASRQEGQLTVASEQGMRLQMEQGQSVVQLDPETLGMGDRDALVFRLLNQDWRLSLEVAQLPPWVQVDGFQSFRISDARAEVETRFQYEIKNAGVRSLNLSLPREAEGVRILGEHVSDFEIKDASTVGNRQQWTVTLDRRVLGSYALRIYYSIALATGVEQVVLLSDLAEDVRLQRGYLAVSSEGRLQVSVENMPRAIQSVGWQSIPREWRQQSASASSRLSYRLVQPDFALPLRLIRREIARLLPAQVKATRLRSVVADAGAVLTEVSLELDPGDKRLLPIELETSDVFWYALVNGRSVWPWQDETGRVLIPLEAAAQPGEPTRLEFLYASSLPQTHSRRLSIDLVAPGFDLPLENVTWQVLMDEKWQLKHVAGTMQPSPDRQENLPAKIDWDRYLQTQQQEQVAQSRDAQRMLQLGNQLLVEGDPRFAQKAFEEAYNLSRNDAAFNEDARVQLRNLKSQQAVLGLNARNYFLENQLVGGSASTTLAVDQDLSLSQENLERFAYANTADVNVAFNQQAERIIQQQEAAIESVEMLRATFPEIGITHNFTRGLQVENWSSLELALEARLAEMPMGWGSRMGFFLLWLGIIWIVLLLVHGLNRYGRPQ